MAKKPNKTKTPSSIISQNRIARHDYFIEKEFEAGLVLEGWEVKSLRAGHCQLKESYVILRKNEAWLIGAHISPLISASTHIKPDPIRSRKLLLHDHEIKTLIGKVTQQGHTIVPLDLHWSKGKAKAKIGLAKGKKQHDKRQSLKEKDWQRSQQRGFKEQ